MNLFMEKIGNKKISFDLIKYKISSELKLLIYIKILNAFFMSQFATKFSLSSTIITFL